jgi:hypothetical protein
VRGVREHGKSRVAASLWRYGKNALLIILRSMRDVRPLTFFGLIAVCLLAVGVLCGLFVFGWWVHTGHTTPFRSVLVGSATFLLLGFLVGVLALLADMIGRLRRTAEQTHLIERRRYYDHLASRERRRDPLAPHRD